MQNIDIEPCKTYHPEYQHWYACMPLRYLSLVQVNPPEAELVTHRRTIQVLWREVAEHTHTHTHIH